MRRVAALATVLGVALAANVGCADSAEFDDALYAELLTRYTREVSDLERTRVDYSGLRASEQWRALVASLAAADPDRARTREQRLAFWINAYNVFAIDLIVKHGPVESIRDLGSLFSSVWSREAGRIHGSAYTLDQIEHEILRPMGEPRIHFAIVCASLSCPPLLREPWRADAIDAQLDAALNRFVRDPDKGARLSREARELHLSQIFKWFEEDFAKLGGVKAYVVRHLPEQEREWLAAQDSVRIVYLDYDWSLNGR